LALSKVCCCISPHTEKPEVLREFPLPADLAVSRNLRREAEAQQQADFERAGRDLTSEPISISEAGELRTGLSDAIGE
jgi:hypothetical protein